VRAVWLNELGGTTFALDNGSEYVKVYPELFEAYGVEPDRERIAYYRLRWEE
jgi:hypothetical protein